jgi:hypothetical protein
MFICENCPFLAAIGEQWMANERLAMKPGVLSGGGWQPFWDSRPGIKFINILFD